MWCFMYQGDSTKSASIIFEIVEDHMDVSKSATICRQSLLSSLLRNSADAIDFGCCVYLKVGVQQVLKFVKSIPLM